MLGYSYLDNRYQDLHERVELGWEAPRAVMDDAYLRHYPEASRLEDLVLGRENLGLQESTQLPHDLDCPRSSHS